MEERVKILLYGSTYITERCAALLSKHHEIVGHVPNQYEPTIPGRMSVPIVAEADVEHDIRLSIQYDASIHLVGQPAYDVHTGLLPRWGGNDILYHTLRQGANEQGLTFCQISDRQGCGYIISKITYPVRASDTMVDLYERVARIAPLFVVTALSLLELLGLDLRSGAMPAPPVMFHRGDIQPGDRGIYAETPRLICERLGIELEG
jgi:hypothetical protein